MIKLIRGLLLAVLVASCSEQPEPINVRVAPGYITVVRFDSRDTKIEYDKKDVPAGFNVTPVDTGIAIKTLSSDVNDNQIPFIANGYRYILSVNVVKDEPETLVVIEP